MGYSKSSSAVGVWGFLTGLLTLNTYSPFALPPGRGDYPGPLSSFDVEVDTVDTPQLNHKKENLKITKRPSLVFPPPLPLSPRGPTCRRGFTPYGHGAEVASHKAALREHACTEGGQRKQSQGSGRRKKDLGSNFSPVVND